MTINQTAGGTQRLLLEVNPDRAKAVDVFEMIPRKDELLWQCADALDEIYALGVATPPELSALNTLKKILAGRRRPETV